MEKKLQAVAQNSVWKLLNDLSSKKGITEIAINDCKNVFVEREGKFIQLNVQLTKNDIVQFIQDVATFNQKVCNESNPILDGSLPDGSRINAIVEPFCTGSPAISIRKYIRGVRSFESNPGVFGLFDKWVTFFKAMIAARVNIVVSGGTGVGKTTFLNLLLNEIDPEERVVTIEDTLELNINVPNLVRLEASHKALSSDKNMSIRDLVKNTLRMRPDRIIIGEVRGGELFDLLQAMNTGHDGSMTSVHANNPSECIARMETLFLLAGFEVPFKVLRKLITSAVHFIIQIDRNRDGKRVVREILELTGMNGDTVLSQQIAVYDDDDGALRPTGIVPSCIEILVKQGGLSRSFFEN